MQSIGTITKIMRYPIKSMGGERMKEAVMTERGLEGDRVYAVVEHPERVKFPWLTGRQEADLVRFRASLTKEKRLEAESPEGERFANQEALLLRLRRRFSRNLTMRHREEGIPDAAPISLLGLASVAALEREAGFFVDPQRFRANLLVTWINQQPWMENTLVGKEIRVGENVRLLVQERSSRCRMITFDPNTGKETKELLDHVRRQHEGCVGVYASVLVPGTVQEGDPIYPFSS